MLGSGTARAPPPSPKDEEAAAAKRKRKAELLVALKKRRAAFNTAVARAESAASRAAAKAASLGDQDLLLPGVLFENVLRYLGTPTDILGRVALASKACARAVHGGRALVASAHVHEFARFKISSTSELIKVLKLRAFTSLTCLDFGKHGRCFSHQCTSRNCLLPTFRNWRRETTGSS